MISPTNDMTDKLKLFCDKCEIIFYVLGDRFECPECGEMIDPKSRFNLGSKGRKDWTESEHDTKKTDSHDGDDHLLDAHEALEGGCESAEISTDDEVV